VSGAGTRFSALPREFWERARRAASRLLAVDYDGTLAPLRDRPEDAVPLPGMIEVLGPLSRSRRTQVAVVSGRPLEQVATLVPIPGLTLIGEHGWETRRPGGLLMREALPEEVSRALERLAAAVTGEAWAGAVERKRTALRLHTRLLPFAEGVNARHALRRLWRAHAGGVLALEPVHGGMEIRARGEDKGTALRVLLGAMPPGTLPVYLGDDTTDEDAFRALGREGVTIRVGDSGSPTAARHRLRDPDEVLGFLQRWRDELEEPAA
jgi:trehalose-phosphatase